MIPRRAALEKVGFEGFVPFSELPTAEVPSSHGVYLILRISDAPPLFRKASTGGWFKGRDPSVAIATLRSAWVEAEEIVYIGKAGGSARRGLRKRLDEYRRYGAGDPVGHQGGRYVWQLEDSDDLLVAWRTTPDNDPGDVETAMIVEFRERTGSLPFANLRH